MADVIDIVLKITDKGSGSVKEVTRSLQDLDKEAQGVTSRGLSGLQTMLKVGIVGAVGAATAALAGFGAATVNSIGKAVDFESAFTGVIKTVDATDAELAALRQGILDMSSVLPTSASEIAGIAEAAGQLGIETQNVLGFTRVMADLGVTTNMSSNDAATALARLANITGMSQTDFDRLGSTIVALGNNLATTEGEIVEMALRIAGAGSQIGLTEAEILSFAGALSSVGIEAEAGGSAISRVMIDIASAVANGGDKLDSFSLVAGMSAEQFSTAFREDAAGAVLTFIEGLNGISQSGGNVFGVLEELGLSEIRVRDALLRASGAGDLFRNSLVLGSEAWRENIALTKEAELRYGTTESKLQLFRNAIDTVQIGIGDALLPVLGELTGWATELVQEYGPQVVQWFGEFATALEAGINYVSAFLKDGDYLNDWLTHLPSPIQNVVVAVGDFVTGVQSIIQPIVETVTQLVSWKDILAAVAYVLATIAVPAIGSFLAAIAPAVGVFAALVGASALLRNAWENDWLGIRSALTSAWEVVSSIFSAVSERVGWIVSTFQGKWAELIATNATLGERLSLIWETIKAVAVTVWQGIVETVSTLLPSFIARLQEWGQAAWQWIVDVIPQALTTLGEWLGSIITWLGDNLPNFLVAILEWGTALYTWIGDAIPKAINALADFIKGIREKGEGDGNTSFGDMVRQWATRLWRWIVDDLIPAVGPAFLDFIKTVMKYGKDLLIALGNLAKELGLLLWQWIRDAMGPAGQKLAEWGRMLWDWIKSNAPEWGRRLAEWAKLAWEWIVDATTPALQKLGEWGAALWGWIKDNAPIWADKIAEWAAIAWEWIRDVAIPVALEKLGEWGSALWEWVKDNAPIWADKIAEWAAIAWQWIRDVAIPEALKKLGEWGQALWEWVKDNAPEWKRKLLEWANAAWEWIRDVAIPEALKKLGEWGTQLKTWVGNQAREWAEKFKNAGRDIIEGLRKGIEEKWNNLTSWFSGVWGNLTSRFKSFFGIRSPSTLFAQYGRNLMEGLQQGISEGAKDVLAGVDSIAGQITSKIDGAVKAVKSTAGQITSGGSNIGNFVPEETKITTLGEALGLDKIGAQAGASSVSLLGGITLEAVDLKAAKENSKAAAEAAAKTLEDFIGGFTDFLKDTLEKSNSVFMLDKLKQEDALKKGADALQKYLGSETHQLFQGLRSVYQGIQNSVADILGVKPSELNVTSGDSLRLIDRVGDVLKGTDINTNVDFIGRLLQELVNFRSLANTVSNNPYYDNPLPTDNRLTGGSTVNNYNINLMGSSNDSADIISTVQLLQQLNGTAIA